MKRMRRILSRKHFHEMDDLESLIGALGSRARTRVLAEVNTGEKSFPVYAVIIGSEKPESPAVGFFGGVHGLEKIGSEVVLSHLHTIHELLGWDKSFQRRLEDSRLVFMPIVNPVGIVNRTRSNGNGVDLMRNSPLEASEPGGALYRGHRLSPQLPWYRGPAGAPMEVEAQALCEVVRTELMPSRLSLAVDVHSGFGARDRFWFPFAHTKEPFPLLAEAYALKELFDETYPHHFYAFEPMSRQYTIRGDLWDYLFLEHRKLYANSLFIPFTLEMGSWLWLKKNPMQVFSRFGPFHPMKAHRLNRILRRHLNLFDFLHRSVLSSESWAFPDPTAREELELRAKTLWYG